jgi:hypothetical protein
MIRFIGSRRQGLLACAGALRGRRGYGAAARVETTPGLSGGGQDVAVSHGAT